ncbi:MAG: hypothetical protein NTV61_06155 [Candidatus Bathyarchaeota archaeon]|nr:hypothetical protein [Candidatus Bathyarchaeota archaeon]
MSHEDERLIAEAKAKLSEPELKALNLAIHYKTLEMVSSWMLEDIDRIDHLKRSEDVIYCRILWILGEENEFKSQVDEWEAEKIRALRKLGMSIAELARVFQRSKSTIHDHIHDSPSLEESRELDCERLGIV